MRLFSLLPSKEQSAHSARVKAVGGEAQRQLRQQDVVVSAVAYLTNRLLTAEVYKGHIRLKVSRGPIRVRRAQVAEIAGHLDTLLKLVSTEASLDFL
jgi:hypothetical protein